MSMRTKMTMKIMMMMTMTMTRASMCHPHLFPLSCIHVVLSSPTHLLLVFLFHSVIFHSPIIHDHPISSSVFHLIIQTSSTSSDSLLMLTSHHPTSPTAGIHPIASKPSVFHLFERRCSLHTPIRKVHLFHLILPAKPSHFTLCSFSRSLSFILDSSF